MRPILIGNDRKPSKDSGVRAVICGAGPRGLAHAEAMQKIPGLQLCGFLDVSSNGRERATQATGLPAFSELDDLIQECDPQLAVLATPPHARTALVRQIAETGHLRALVIEKPVALNLKAAREIFSVCQERKIGLRVCHQMRFSPEFVRLRQALRSGEIGQVESLEASCIGNLFNQGTHMFDMLCWLLDASRAAWVAAQGSDNLRELGRLVTIPADFEEDQQHPAPLSILATIGFSGGVQATLNSGLLAPIHEPALGPWLQKKVVVHGSQGIAEAHVASHFKLVNASNPHGLVERTGLDSFVAATRAFHEDFVSALQHNPASLQDMEANIHATEMLFASLHSVFQGGLVGLPLDEASDSYVYRPAQKADAAVRSPMAPAEAAEKPRVSVILPMADHRGLGLRAIESWVNDQRSDARDFELILITDKAVRDLLPQIRARLRPFDQLIDLETDNEMEQYHAGARQANGEYLLFTEPHCIAEPEAIAQIIHFFETQDFDGLCARSNPICVNHIARNEMRMYDEGFKKWSQPEHWAKVILRGFGIRKTVYLEVGGFNFPYGRFSEWLLAATLKQRGYRLAYAPGLGVHHLYASNFPLLDRFIKEFTDGESQFRQEGPQAMIRDFFGEPPEWSEARSFNPALLVVLVKTLTAEILRPRRGFSRRFKWQEAPQQLMRLLPLVVLGRRILVYRHEYQVRAAKFWYYFWRYHAEKRFRAFVDWYTRTTELYRVKFAFEHPSPTSARDGPRHAYSMESITPQDSFGFHAMETNGGTSFRWSSPVAALKLSMDRRDYQLSMKSAGVRRFQPQHEISIYIDGHRLESMEYDRDRVCLKAALPAAALAESDSHWLVIYCAPWRVAGVHRRDRRKLGIPMVRLDLQPAS